MRLPRMTTRRWMIVVALVAAITYAWMIVERSRSSYAVQAAIHAERARECWRIIEADAGNRLDPAIWHDWKAYARRARRLFLYHAALRRKYERASRRPWLPVEPDPPEPDALFVGHGERERRGDDRGRVDPQQD